MNDQYKNPLHYKNDMALSAIASAVRCNEEKDGGGDKPSLQDLFDSIYKNYPDFVKASVPKLRISRVSVDTIAQSVSNAESIIGLYPSDENTESSIIEILADLQHLCKSKNIDFYKLFAMASVAFYEELNKKKK